MKHKAIIAVSLTCVGLQLAGCGGLDVSRTKRIVDSYNESDQRENSGDTKAQQTKSSDPASKLGQQSQAANPGAQNPQNVTNGVPSGTLTTTNLNSTVEVHSQQAINSCLKAWNGKAPFNEKSPFRTIVPGVTVFGIGTAVYDAQKTTSPELVLVPAGVNVLGSVTYKLLNPNGWYCLAAAVNVLGGLSIEIDAAAQLADSNIDVMVAGKQNSTSTGFVTVNVGGGINLKVVNK